MQVIGYVRVSTEEQGTNGVGLEAQRQAITAECERRGWTLRELIEDRGYSAKNLRRGGIQSALTMLKTGDAEALVVAKLDRLSRSMQDFTELMATAQKQGWAIVALDFNMDTTTPNGEMMANVLASFAQFERRLIGQRTKEAMAVKRAQGVRLGRPREMDMRIVKRIRRERAKGMTLQAIADSLNRGQVPTARGGGRWWPSTIQAVLRSQELSRNPA
jgi:DNA invertase Pin-like site-specific DNA recombinase